MKKITSDQLADQLQTEATTIIDVRAADKFTLNHLTHTNASVSNIPKKDIFELEHSNVTIELPFSKEDPVVLTCTTGNSATRCAHILSEKGYNVSVLEGGMTAWNQSNASQNYQK